jgi:hypothetical protein
MHPKLDHMQHTQGIDMCCAQAHGSCSCYSRTAARHRMCACKQTLSHKAAAHILHPCSAPKAAVTGAPGPCPSSPHAACITSCKFKAWSSAACVHAARSALRPSNVRTHPTAAQRLRPSTSSTPPHPPPPCTAPGGPLHPHAALLIQRGLRPKRRVGGGSSTTPPPPHTQRRSTPMLRC